MRLLLAELICASIEIFLLKAKPQKLIMKVRLGTIFGILWALDVNRELLFVGTLLAALPMPIAFGIFGQHYGLDEKALVPLVLSTILGFVMVAILLTQSGKYL